MSDTDKFDVTEEFRANLIKRLQAKDPVRGWRFITAVAMMMLGALGAALSVIGFVNLISDKRPPVSNPDLIPPLAADLQEMKKEVERLNATVSVLQKPPAEAAVSIEQARISAMVETLLLRQKAIDDAIIESPERALSLPLLRKDVQDLTIRLEESRAITRAEFDRLHSQQKWMLGGIGTVLFTLAAGSLSFILTSLSKGRDRDEKTLQALVKGDGAESSVEEM